MRSEEEGKGKRNLQGGRGKQEKKGNNDHGLKNMESKENYRHRLKLHIRKVAVLNTSKLKVGLWFLNQESQRITELLNGNSLSTRPVLLSLPSIAKERSQHQRNIKEALNLSNHRSDLEIEK